MRVLIDTNVILDVLCDREGLAGASALVLKICELHRVEGFVSALSFPNIAYILRKELTPERAGELVNYLSLILQVAELKAADVKAAVALPFRDFEDALQSVCASRIRAQYIVTRNIRDFKTGKVPAIRPEELPERL